jgi:hypothetical protein
MKQIWDRQLQYGFSEAMGNLPQAVIWRQLWGFSCLSSIYQRRQTWRVGVSRYDSTPRLEVNLRSCYSCPHVPTPSPLQSGGLDRSGDDEGLADLSTTALAILRGAEREDDPYEVGTLRERAYTCFTKPRRNSSWFLSSLISNSWNPWWASVVRLSHISTESSPCQACWPSRGWGAGWRGRVRWGHAAFFLIGLDHDTLSCLQLCN